MSDMHIAEIRDLAQRLSVDEIEKCMQSLLEHQDEPGFDSQQAEQTMSVLAKAEFVKVQMERGSSLAEAMRELGRRIRAVQGGSPGGSGK